MQDRKALQAGTSHFLGQHFSRASGITYLDATDTEQYAWTTSWGVSTRLVGGLIMTHSDDDGLIVPPRLAPLHVVILPVIHAEGSRAEVLDYCETLAAALRERMYDGRPVQVRVDTREMRGGEKTWSWIKKGVPLRVEVGPRDIASDSVFVGRRDRAPRDRASIKRDEFVATIAEQLDAIQQGLYDRAASYRDEHTRRIDSLDEFRDFFTPANAEKPEIHGGFAMCHYNGSVEVEQQIKDELNVTIRCIPADGDDEPGTCIFTGEPSPRRVVFAKAY